MKLLTSLVTSVLLLLLADQLWADGEPSTISKEVSVPSGKYQAYTIPAIGAKLVLQIKPDSGKTIKSSGIFPDDTSDTALWVGPNQQTGNLHEYKSGVVLSSREWLAVHGELGGGNGSPGGNGNGQPGTPPPPAPGFIVEVPAVNIDLVGVNEEDEDTTGGQVLVNANNSDADAFTDLDPADTDVPGESDLVELRIYRPRGSGFTSGNVVLTATRWSGGNAVGNAVGSRIDFWTAATKGPRVSSLSFPVDSLPPAGKPIWIQGLAATAAAETIELKASYSPAADVTAVDTIRLTVGLVDFAEFAKFSGFDHTVTPHWLVVPAGGSNKCKVKIPGGGTYFFQSSHASLTHDHPGAQSADFALEVTAGGALPVNDYEIVARAGAADGPIVNRLKVRVLPRKEIVVAFVTPVAPFYQPETDTSKKNGDNANQVFDWLNLVWNKQANVYFKKHATHFWRQGNVAPVRWGPVLNGRQPLPQFDDALRVWAAVRDQVPEGIQQDVLYFFFHTHVEIDAGESTAERDDDEEAFYEHGMRTAFFDDVTCDDTEAYPHETGHHLGWGSVHFDHKPGTAGDFQKDDNLMNRCKPDVRKHITARQAKAANP